MKNIKKGIIILIAVMAIAACKQDFNADFDMYSPQADIPVDTFAVASGGKVTLKATLTDMSGVASYRLEYDKWEISEEKKLDEVGNPKTYNFETEITVPVDAQLSWTEKYQKNDGSSFDITQTYHKISLTFYDTVRNKNIVYFYVKINE